MKMRKQKKRVEMIFFHNYKKKMYDVLIEIFARNKIYESEYHKKMIRYKKWGYFIIVYMLSKNE